MAAVRRVFGTTTFAREETGRGFRGPQDIDPVLNLLIKHGITELDTARVYVREGCEANKLSTYKIERRTKRGNVGEC
jgi:aryl-alcohol dehydrogenase-like predicted oxidoreductase